jgi:hypothetical protein
MKYSLLFLFLAFFAFGVKAQDNALPHALLKVQLQNRDKISEQQKSLLALKNAKIVNYIAKDNAYLLALEGKDQQELAALRKKIESIFGASGVSDFKISDPNELEALPTNPENKQKK